MKNLLVWLSLSLCSLSFAEQPAQFSNHEDQLIYQITKGLCSRAQSSRLASLRPSGLHAQVFMTALMPSSDELKPSILEKNQYLVGILPTLINSIGFMRGMQECYPNEGARSRQVISLFVAEGSAKFLQIYGLGKFLARGGYLIYHSPLVRRLAIWTGVTITSVSLASSSDDHRTPLQKQIDSEVELLQIGLQKCRTATERDEILSTIRNLKALRILATDESSVSN